VILLDTHVLVWFAEDSGELGRKATRSADRALQRGEVAVSAVTFWEIAMLAERGRLTLDLPPIQMRLETLRRGISEIPVSGEIAIAAAQLAHFHGDPADRMIVATAISNGAILLTADESVLGWRGPLRTQDARA
jgi:PIN domain nuclease of toxin-antitoxin system